MMVDCAQGCGTRIDPEQLPGGLCRACFGRLPAEDRRRLQAAFTRVRKKAAA